MTNIKRIFASFVLIALGSLFLRNVTPTYAYANPAAVNLLTVTNFAALAKSAITNSVAGTVLNNGDMGLDSPATCTGFIAPCTGTATNGTINNGTIQYQNAVALQGQTDATAVVTNLNGRTADQTIAGGVLDGLTLQQGVYAVPSATTNLTGDLTLNGDANSIFIFQASSDFITAGTSRILFTGGAQACNVYWTVASAATFDGATSFAGSVFAGTSINFTAGGATFNGRAIAQTAAITFNNTTVNKPTCAAVAVSSSALDTSPGVAQVPPCVEVTSDANTIPTILSTTRLSPTSISATWGPYAGITSFNLRYGFENGTWLYNFDVDGFTATINDLPANQPIWISVASRNYCSVGSYGASMRANGIYSSARLGGVPGLPNTGNDPARSNVVWYVVGGILVAVIVLIKKAHILNQ